MSTPDLELMISCSQADLRQKPRGSFRKDCRLYWTVGSLWWAVGLGASAYGR